VVNTFSLTFRREFRSGKRNAYFRGWRYYDADLTDDFVVGCLSMDRRVELYRSVGEAMHLAQTLELKHHYPALNNQRKFGIDIDQRNLF